MLEASTRSRNTPAHSHVGAVVPVKLYTRNLIRLMLTTSYTHRSPNRAEFAELGKERDREIEKWGNREKRGCWVNNQERRRLWRWRKVSPPGFAGLGFPTGSVWACQSLMIDCSPSPISTPFITLRAKTEVCLGMLLVRGPHASRRVLVNPGVSWSGFMSLAWLIRAFQGKACMFRHVLSPAPGKWHESWTGHAE